MVISSIVMVDTEWLLMGFVVVGGDAKGPSKKSSASSN